jgi:recombination protein RecA
MAKAKNVSAESLSNKKESADEIADLTAALIKDVNKEFGMRVAYNLAEDDAPTVVKRWIDTGSVQLNYAIRNMPGGGYPEGRIIEIAGPTSIGKSHLAYAAAAHVQKLGGLVVYVDTENATPLDKLQQMGINVKKGFVYMDMHATEHIFQAIENTIIKSKSLAKDVPILVIWDSVAGSSPLAELNGEYEQTTMGLQARALSKGFRKITGIIGQNNVTLLLCNQLRDAIGVTHGDPSVSPGGKAIPYYSSIRLRLTSGTQVKDSNGNVIGIHVIATIKKNKVAPPFRKYEFDIIFGKGISEAEYIFDEVRSYCVSNKVFDTYENKKVEVAISGTGAWKSFTITDAASGEVYVEKKFYKNEFRDIMKHELYKPYVDKIIEATYTIVFGDDAVLTEGEGADGDDLES